MRHLLPLALLLSLPAQAEVLLEGQIRNLGARPYDGQMELISVYEAKNLELDDCWISDGDGDYYEVTESKRSPLVPNAQGKYSVEVPEALPGSPCRLELKSVLVKFGAAQVVSYTIVNIVDPFRPVHVDAPWNNERNKVVCGSASQWPENENGNLLCRDEVYKSTRLNFNMPKEKRVKLDFDYLGELPRFGQAPVAKEFTLPEGQKILVREDLLGRKGYYSTVEISAPFHPRSPEAGVYVMNDSVDSILGGYVTYYAERKYPDGGQAFLTIYEGVKKNALPLDCDVTTHENFNMMVSVVRFGGSFGDQTRFTYCFRK